MQVIKSVRPLSADYSLPPLYTWPLPVKRIILMAAAGACLVAYTLLTLGGLLGAWFLWLALALD